MSSLLDTPTAPLAFR